MKNPFRYFKTSPEVIRLAVMLYVRFPLSLRSVEDLLHERGIDLSHETVRFWWNRFGPMLASEIRRKRADRLRAWPQWQWHLDEMFVKINGDTHYLWRAVDHEGEVLEAFVTKRRNRQAALKYLRKAMKRYGQPKTIVTDRLNSYRAAMKTIGNEGDQEVGRWLNNRAENSHLPLRRRERAMLRFRRMQSLQKFAAVHSVAGSARPRGLAAVGVAGHNHFNLERHINDRNGFKANRQTALAEWRQLAA
jgi:putative transposase